MKGNLPAALGILGLLAVLAAFSLHDEKLRWFTFIVLGFFAAKILIWHRHTQIESADKKSEGSQVD